MLLVFFFNDTATTEIYTLSLHDALPISPARPSRPAPRTPPPRSGARRRPCWPPSARERGRGLAQLRLQHLPDRKSTRLNSSHANISYAVFCLKKNLKPVFGADLY